MNDTFEKRLAKATSEVDAVVLSYLPRETGPQKTVLEAMNYSVRAGGKRLRPLFMRETYRVFGGAGEEIEPFMAAVEMIHTSSLVHDDLPCMDDDELRRGRPTTWKAYGYDMAVLAGDALMIYAFETAVKALSFGGDPARVVKATGVLAEKTGIYGMIGGQTVDVELTGRTVPEETLGFIYRLKTGALIEASMMIGAILAGASECDVNNIENIASDIGTAFQIRDDILDVESSSETLGKPVQSDEKNEKTTYVTLFGLKKAREDVGIISNRAIEGIRNLPGDSAFLEEIAESLIAREK